MVLEKLNGSRSPVSAASPHPAVADVARQIIPLVQGVGHGIAELGIRYDLWRDGIEPRLQGVEDRQAVLLPEATNAIGLRFPGGGPPPFLQVFEGIYKAPPEWSHASATGVAQCNARHAA